MFEEFGTKVKTFDIKIEFFPEGFVYNFLDSNMKVFISYDEITYNDNRSYYIKLFGEDFDKEIDWDVTDYRRNPYNSNKLNGTRYRTTIWFK
jgi:hypothetical protein